MRRGSVHRDITILGERNWRNLVLGGEDWRELLKKARAVKPMMLMMMMMMMMRGRYFSGLNLLETGCS
jgi:hypothetical protein